MRIKSVTVKEIIFYLLSLIFIAFLLIFPSENIEAAKDGLMLSLFKVLPSLFPFAVISAYLAERFCVPSFIAKPVSRLFNISENAAFLFLLGFFSGYPVGAFLVASYVKEKRLSKDEGEHILPFCNACGPLFLIGAVGGMFGSYEIGYFLYGVHLVSVLAVFFAVKRFAPIKTKTVPIKKEKKTGAFVFALEKAAQSMINVCACIVFFSVVCCVLKKTGVFAKSPFLYGVAELTNGLSRIAFAEMPMRLRVSLASALCGFSGICILMQVKNAVKDLRISTKKYVIFKLIISLVSFCVSYITFPFFPALAGTFGCMPKTFGDSLTSVLYIAVILLVILGGFMRKVMGSFFDKRG